MAERLACFCAHRVVCVSESLRQKAESLGIGQPGQMRILGLGSCNGIEVGAYSLDASARQPVDELRRNLGIPEDPTFGCCLLAASKRENPFPQRFVVQWKEIPKSYFLGS
jgi:hypothetical protein